MNFPSVPRTLVITGAILLLGLGGVILAFGQELVAWSQVMRRRFESGQGGPSPVTTVPSLSAAAVVAGGYLRARLGR